MTVMGATVMLNTLRTAEDKNIAYTSEKKEISRLFSDIRSGKLNRQPTEQQEVVIFSRTPSVKSNKT